MKRFLIILSILVLTCILSPAQKVTVDAQNQPASTVFRSIIELTGKNFVYSSDLLNNIKITIKATDMPLKKVLSEMFTNTDIEYKIKGNNVILKRNPKKLIAIQNKPLINNRITHIIDSALDKKILENVEVVSRLESPVVETAEIGAKKVTADEVKNTPVLFGEADVIKALHTQPGVTEGTEGMAGMHVHGGNADENLYMLDNVPLYQVNHFAGLFSAFNTDIIRYIDFFKSSIPAKYDGRLSSFMDVRLQNGFHDGHHGTARLGLTSGAFNISGPIGEKTAYVFGLRRSWYDVLSVPALAIINPKLEEQIRFHYYFMDVNAKITHRFSNKATGLVNVYFGDDMLKSGTKDSYFDDKPLGYGEKDKYDFHWGNLVVQTGMNYRFNSNLSTEITAAFTRYFSMVKHHNIYVTTDEINRSITEDWMKTDNSINDWIFRSDFDWMPNENSRIRFGANYVRHSFLPSHSTRVSITDASKLESRDSTSTYGANEFNAFIEDDWKINEKFRVSAGLHASMFNIDDKMKHGIAPRLSLSYRPKEDLALKAAYSRTVQYVHQLSQSYLSLPTDQWIPVSGNFKPETADKIAVGGYWQTSDKKYTISVEGYYKWMHNLIEYCDEYYLKPPLESWNARLTQGRGTAKGIDFKIEKNFGKVTGHISYSLAWSDRTFSEKNGGITYPARFDNRHTINILVNWNINNKVQLNALWTGHSGNRFTLLTQMWQPPTFASSDGYSYYDVPLKEMINNYQLPFYHRLDVSCKVKNSRGYWTFGLYNAYNHMNIIAIKRDYKDEWIQNPNGSYSLISTFKKVKLLPILPSISYTWEF